MCNEFELVKENRDLLLLVAFKSGIKLKRFTFGVYF